MLRVITRACRPCLSGPSTLARSTRRSPQSRFAGWNCVLFFMRKRVAEQGTMQSDGRTSADVINWEIPASEQPASLQPAPLPPATAPLPPPLFRCPSVPASPCLPAAASALSLQPVRARTTQDLCRQAAPPRVRGPHVSGLGLGLGPGPAAVHTERRCCGNATLNSRS